MKGHFAGLSHTTLESNVDSITNSSIYTYHFSKIGRPICRLRLVLWVYTVYVVYNRTVGRTLNQNGM